MNVSNFFPYCELNQKLKIVKHEHKLFYFNIASFCGWTCTTLGELAAGLTELTNSSYSSYSLSESNVYSEKQLTVTMVICCLLIFWEWPSTGGKFLYYKAPSTATLKVDSCYCRQKEINTNVCLFPCSEAGARSLSQSLSSMNDWRPCN